MARILDAGTQLALKGMASTVLRVASGLVSSRLAPEADPGAFLMTDAEVEHAAEPASRLLARHAPLPGGAKSSDIADFVDLFTALVAYALQATERAQIARATGEPSAAGTYTASADGVVTEDGTPAAPYSSEPAGPGTFGGLR